MARPFVYKNLDRRVLPSDSRETMALGVQHMWGVKKGDDWVTICRQDAYGIDANPNRKYVRLFFASKAVAQTHCNKLNRIFNTQDYQIEQI